MSAKQEKQFHFAKTTLKNLGEIPDSVTINALKYIILPNGS